MAAEQLIEVTDDSFEADVLKNEKTVVVDYWAEWCGPCRQVAPVLEEIAAEHADKIDIVKLNVDENPKVAMKYGIMKVPPPFSTAWRGKRRKLPRPTALPAMARISPMREPHCSRGAAVSVTSPSTVWKWVCWGCRVGGPQV